MLDVPRAERSLNDELIRTPVPDADDGIPEHDGIPWHDRIVGRPQHGPVFRRRIRNQLPDTAHLGQSDDGQDDRADNHDIGREALRDHDRGQAAHDRVTGRDDREKNHTGPDIPSEEAHDHQASRIQADAQPDESIGNHIQPRQECPASRAVPALEEFGYRGNFCCQVIGYEDEGQEKQASEGHPFVVALQETGHVPRTGQAHEMFRRNIARKNRISDHPPGHVTARQKEVLGRMMLASLNHADRDQSHDEEADDDEIQSG